MKVLEIAFRKEPSCSRREKFLSPTHWYLLATISTLKKLKIRV